MPCLWEPTKLSTPLCLWEPTTNCRPLRVCLGIGTTANMPVVMPHQVLYTKTLTLAPRPACQFLSTTLLLARVLGYSGADRVNRQRSSKVPLTGARPRKAVVEAF
jgi:hypothetical protein